ncbi:Glyoxylase, beta-lactamase superfamily II [Streptoalloteichus tenebrarius]|uniref:Glyoxylase, beta-lactamase superfamily II n=1 Tax=Streptoalloteichus tenebrarius (strain ATCC 17920 / DSM 40477 / JCM 4838 / CBS 697.72 / NBRC 16177 / NCIMB 11028 / NRRL B-12390 / A12253. 1 / ISP 5477) TaxID=1933 RepID=A0ABT1HTB6_STRSD|nr:MBL fold metallo-hydrolase [Streptoalloteichus tenebrarius]MCP2258747.1 Glyoxylase, beta-lactamase superfamily II [Streptoalloteichus tenebrarius]BFF02901.1 MBL fold metallo-hydrolase [Streptoalloteichus tenebrarius]
MATPFASSADLAERTETFEVLADGVYALTAEGDPNVGAIEGEDFLVCFDARATPLMAERWLGRLREHTGKPVRYLVLSHYHAVRALGAEAFDAEIVVAHAATRRLIAERGEQDWASELGRMPRLFQGHESIPGLTWPTLTFTDRVCLDLGGDRGALELAWFGRGHTAGDVVAWLPRQRVLFAGDLVETRAALYTGDAYHHDWLRTLDALDDLGAEVLVGGRGEVARGREAVEAAFRLTHDFLTTLLGCVTAVVRTGGRLEEAFRAADNALTPTYGRMPIYSHVLPFDVTRAWEELTGEEHPEIWTPERDREVWRRLVG